MSDEGKIHVKIGDQEYIFPVPTMPTINVPMSKYVSSGDTITFATGNEVDVTEPVDYTKYAQQVAKFNTALTQFKYKVKDATEATKQQVAKFNTALIPPEAEVDLGNRLGDIVYGSTSHSPKGVKVGDKITLTDRNDEMQMEATVDFVEGESIGYRVTEA